MGRCNKRMALECAGGMLRSRVGRPASPGSRRRQPNEPDRGGAKHPADLDAPPFDAARGTTKATSTAFAVA